MTKEEKYKVRVVCNSKHTYFIRARSKQDAEDFASDEFVDDNIRSDFQPREALEDYFSNFCRAKGIGKVRKRK